MAQYPGEIKSQSVSSAAGTSVTGAFWIPRGTRAMTIVAPDLTTDTAYVLQIATPATLQGGTETWTALVAHDLQDASAAAVSIADNTATMIFPVPSGATCRISFTTAQAATFLVIFHD